MWQEPRVWRGWGHVVCWLSWQQSVDGCVYSRSFPCHTFIGAGNPWLRELARAVHHQEQHTTCTSTPPRRSGLGLSAELVAGLASEFLLPARPVVGVDNQLHETLVKSEPQLRPGVLCTVRGTVGPERHTADHLARPLPHTSWQHAGCGQPLEGLCLAGEGPCTSPEYAPPPPSRWAYKGRIAQIPTCHADSSLLLARANQV